MNLEPPSILDSFDRIGHLFEASSEKVCGVFGGGAFAGLGDRPFGERIVVKCLMETSGSGCIKSASIRTTSPGFSKMTSLGAASAFDLTGQIDRFRPSDLVRRRLIVGARC